MKLLLSVTLLASAIALVACHPGAKAPVTASVTANPTSPEVSPRAASSIQTGTRTPAPGEAGRPCVAAAPQHDVELGDETWLICDGVTANGLGYKQIYHSGGRGTSWKLLSAQEAPGMPLRKNGAGAAPPGVVTAFVMTSSHDGWIGTKGPGDNLWRTRDGGATWAPIVLAPAGEAVRSVNFSDPEHAIVHAVRGLWSTSDGGDEWVTISPTPALTATPNPVGPGGCPPSSYTPQTRASAAVFRLDGRRCWMVKDLGASGGTISTQQLFGSNDGGETWSLLAQYGFVSHLTQPISEFGVLPGPKIVVLLFLTPDIGWIGTDEPGPTVSSTRDGGNSWAPVAIENATRVQAINCDDIDVCTVTMHLSTWATRDGGATWTRVE